MGHSQYPTLASLNMVLSLIHTEAEEIHFRTFTAVPGSQDGPSHSSPSIPGFFFLSKSQTAGGFQSSLDVIIL